MEFRMSLLKRVLFTFSLLVQITNIVCNDGVMYSKVMEESDWDEHFCISYNPLFHTLPQQEDLTEPSNLVDLSATNGCLASDYNVLTVNGSVVIVARGNCTFSDKAYLAQSAGARAIVIASPELRTPGAFNESVDYKNINITVATALWKNINDIKTKGSNPLAILFAPVLETRFDPNLVIIFLIAISNIIIGGYWSGKTKHAKYQRLKYKHKRERPSTEGRSRSSSEDSTNCEDEDEETVDISMIVIAIFFVLVCAFLVSLYFFYDYLVYVVIVLFCIAGSMGLYYCLSPLWHKMCPFKARLPENKIPLLKDRPHYRDLALLALCFGAAIFWGVERHASYAWIIQDILGYMFCINVMKSVGIPNLKICTLMLTLLFLYDIFFVFVTPLFTEDGESIMVKVATGSGSKTKEQLPMVFKVPRLTQDAISVCPLPFSLLGFGDIIIPGLLVSYNHAFDLRVKSGRLYYVATCIGYAVGLVITFVALVVMETGQPALLYLVPCTLVTTYVIGYFRGEVKLLWNGFRDADHDSENAPIIENNTSINRNNGNLESAVATSRVNRSQ